MSARLLSYVLWAEGEADRLEASLSSVAGEEARAYTRARMELARGTAKTLDLVLSNEKQFVDLVKADREAKSRADKIRGKVADNAETNNG